MTIQPFLNQPTFSTPSTGRITSLIIKRDKVLAERIRASLERGLPLDALSADKKHKAEFETAAADRGRTRERTKSAREPRSRPPSRGGPPRAAAPAWQSSVSRAAPQRGRAETFRRGESGGSESAKSHSQDGRRAAAPPERRYPASSPSSPRKDSPRHSKANSWDSNKGGWAPKSSSGRHEGSFGRRAGSAAPGFRHARAEESARGGRSAKPPSRGRSSSHPPSFKR